MCLVEAGGRFLNIGGNDIFDELMSGVLEEISTHAAFWRSLLVNGDKKWGDNLRYVVLYL
jgi:hypothetical protein